MPETPQQRRWSWRVIPWIGGLFVAAITALAAGDIVRSYRAVSVDTDRELETQARVIAEQTARSIQAIDVVLRHVAAEYKRGRLSRLTPDDLHTYLYELSVGLNQIDGFGMYDATGAAIALSWPRSNQNMRNIGDLPAFRALRDDPSAELGIGDVFRAEDGVWVLPLGRRLEKPSGEFAGLIGGRGLVDYFQNFYRDLRFDAGTRVTLLRNDGAMLGRYPPAAESLGRKYPIDPTLPSRDSGTAGPLRANSPIDGVERFAALRAVPGYPLFVVVSRDVDAALAGWRAQALGTAGRTLALGLLAGLLLALVTRQVRRLDAARESLQASRERFALAVAGSDDGIWDWNRSNDKIFASARAREIYGLPPGPEMTPRKQWDEELAIHPDDAAAREAAIDAHLKGRTPLYESEYRVRHRDGVYRWVRVRGLCIRDAQGQPRRMAGSVSDIDARRRAEDERRRSEEALRISEERYEVAIAGSNEGMWDWDMRGKTIFYSPRAQELLGFEPGEPTRPAGEWLRQFVYHPDDEKRVHDALEAYLAGQGEHWEVEYRIHHRRTGTWRWFRERGVALRDAQGQPYRMAGSVEDITERKNAEAERDRLEAQLRQSQKIEAIGTLAGGIAHDFNNILAAILGYGEMAQLEAAEGTALRRHVDAAISGALRAKSLVERILAFSRSGIGERVPVHVQAVVEEALAAISASLPSSVRLERDLCAGDAAVLGDATQIHQVVMNLCTNAVQAMRSSGTLAVTLRTIRLDQAKPVATTQLPPGDYVRLSVRDTGTGIGKEVLERIFDPFFTTKVVGVGTGLGLSLVHGIVTDLGGGIEVDSRPGVGSTFTIFLPWQGSAPTADEESEPIVAGNGETILLVDDEETLVRLGEEMLAKIGYEAVGFSSSAAALATFRATPHRFDAVLSDEAMPELTGCELAREIRSIRPGIPIVLMSGYVTPALAERARGLAVHEVLAKPLVARDIARTLAECCTGRAADAARDKPAAHAAALPAGGAMTDRIDAAGE